MTGNQLPVVAKSKTKKARRYLMAKERLLQRPSEPKHTDEWVCLQANRAALSLTIRKARGGPFFLRYREFTSKRGLALLDQLGKCGWRIGYHSHKYLQVVPAAQASARARSS
jgi:hypothetical protein